MNGKESLLGLANIPELKRRLFYLFLGLAIYRFAIHIPAPGINAEAFLEFFQKAGGTLFGFLDIFSGGALRRFSICALGVMPYISASIIMQLMTVVFPNIKEYYKEGPEGRRKIAYYTRYLTVVICLIQGFGIAVGLERMVSPSGIPIVADPGWTFRIMTMITLCAGTLFLVWLGEQMTEHGIGNGISMIIFAGIVAGIFPAVFRTLKFVQTGEFSFFGLLLIFLLLFGILAFTCFMELSQRRIPVHYAKRQVGRQMVGGQTSYLPLKINSAGVIPPIFASSVLMFPATVASFVPLAFFQDLSRLLSPGGILYNLIFAGLIIFFCYFYTAVVFNPKEVAENLKKWGGFVPGIRPGRATEEFLERVLMRITLIGALYVAFICVLPNFLIYKMSIPFYFGGTSLLIVVGVALDLVGQIEAHLLSRQYETFIRQSKIKTR
ncbi:preprotein translocase subunit SecY [Caldimicrobium thiodismutans]|uniref:Protein translocase subunit SecY n=1 Tax=Caldimicrobium thiodismutans TaxID=1653476 RepID=A0A0U4W4T4_9BACT|nr:preprotein translocase subunit SecY [Caldimicrobium thiodismutans]BAU24058.1 preprotein translocase subunit SecY [Caldimicrobium thiodismutans]